MTVCNATAGNLSSLLLGRLELRRGWGRKGNGGGRGQDGHFLGGRVGKPEQSNHLSEPRGSAEPGRALPWVGGKGAQLGLRVRAPSWARLRPAAPKV